MLIFPSLIPSTCDPSVMTALATCAESMRSEPVASAGALFVRSMLLCTVALTSAFHVSLLQLSMSRRANAKR